MKRPTNVGYHCWVTNLTKRDILVGDLGARIPSMKTVDLLDDYHSIYTLDQINKSKECGSLAARLKAKQIIIRETAPQVNNIERTIDVSQVSFPNRNRSIVKNEERIFKELEIGNAKEEEEIFAEEMAESAINDHAATINLLKETINEG